MVRYLLIILASLAITAGMAYAARCFRPGTIPACPTPAPVPLCRPTTEAATAISCYLCHDYMLRRQLT